ncbi:DUF2871 family protein [Arsenicicoccus sp. MKL-02]|uniref:DUF2871 family protein n=1 Tax=Arsenicicoccus cauae TaxID=2663847 RepID=A0A6I3IR41_9MICO|nr:DUF2871 family protein [Arsenicicoccus cauae]MTB70781.1 DUF2871 family protein [Arsenicicoccus cauae]
MTNATASRTDAPTRATLTPIYWGVVAYTALGLLGGVYYRELTKAHDYLGATQLSVVHTHLLALGTLLGLILLGLERAFALSRTAQWKPFLVAYHAGLVVTVAMLTIKGTLQVLGSTAASSPAISGISGLGHILLTVSLVLLLMGLKKRLDA